MRTQHHSVLSQIMLLPPEDRERLLEMLPASLLHRLRSDVFRGYGLRRGQRFPGGDWLVWLLLSGRGFGKSFTLSSVANAWARKFPVFAIVGATSDDVRRVLVEGESGIPAVAPRWFRPEYKKTDRLLEWPNGARGYFYTAVEPDRLRGANNYGGLCDELAAWDNPEETWTQLQLTLRSGVRPRTVVATTPRPIPIIRRLATDPMTYLTTGSTYENPNLAESFLHEVEKRYGGTRLGQQELEGQIVLDVAAALWKPTFFQYRPLDRALRRVVVAVDPTGGGDACGIVVAGALTGDTYIVLEDATMNGSPEQWAATAVRCLDRWKADCIVAETNYGGDMVLSTLKQFNPDTPVRKVTASRGKVVRAEPISLLYEQGRVAHLNPFPELEQQLLLFDSEQGYMGAGSPDRADALVWALTALAGLRVAPPGTGPRAIGGGGRWNPAA